MGMYWLSTNMNYTTNKWKKIFPLEILKWISYSLVVIDLSNQQQPFLSSNEPNNILRKEVCYQYIVLQLQKKIPTIWKKCWDY
jgi:hypothetical protein